MYSPVAVQLQGQVMSLFVARSGLWLRRNLKFLYSEFGVYCFYRMLKSKKVGTVQIRMCGRSKDGTYRTGRAFPLVYNWSLASGTERKWYRIQTTKMCGHRWFWLIGIQPPHVHGVEQHCPPPTSAERATFSSFRLLAKHRSTCKVSSYQLASNAASIQRLTHIFQIILQ